MSQPFVGQVIMFGGTFAPAGWQACAGQLVPIDQFTTLFNLIGTTYGGNGTSTFGLPDLRGRVPIHQGTGAGLSTYVLGQQGGTESVTLQSNQNPIHSHVFNVNNASATQVSPSNNTLANETTNGQPADNAPPYLPYNAAGQTQLSNNAIGMAGGNTPHENRQPVLAVQFCISMFGVYPSQN